MTPPDVLRLKQRIYIACRPDSDVDFNNHPELRGLAERWVRNNTINNAGDLPRFYALALNVKLVLSEGVSGDFAEL